MNWYITDLDLERESFNGAKFSGEITECVPYIVYENMKKCNKISLKKYLTSTEFTPKELALEIYTNVFSNFKFRKKFMRKLVISILYKSLLYKPT